MTKLKSLQKKQYHLYSDKNLDNQLDYNRLVKAKKFYDGNNGDKWKVLERYGSPIEYLVVENLDQGGQRLFQLDSEHLNTYSIQ